ncbi:DUF2182 domain-containing protein [Cupriavidus pampae]|uniref:DUF2182 domain-containing protein n=1 Tax=Cupriavidus pampae TaxID=659251 RepID=A0ABM8XR41_9BURK|nr:DUF2182 domain-containing protein [Cupriavidus pampae]CAG9182763.1 hypothetical protein LMG32289_05188 [Cupriavidus pampae]
MRAAASAWRSAIHSLGRGAPIAGWTVLIVGLSAAAWLYMLFLMGGMDHQSQGQLHDLPVFLVGWIVMLTATMLPSELNYVAAFAILLRGRGKSPVERQRMIVAFIAGYGIAWSAYGLLAYALDSAFRLGAFEWVAWNQTSPYLAGATLVLAGAYQFSTLKHACLTGCRSPLSFFSRYWGEGNLGAIGMGVRHGMVCVGCCWALMAVMFAVGVMSFSWMALLTVFMFAEKMLPQGKRLAAPIAVFLIVMGLWAVAAPETAPLLQPHFLYDSVICYGR